jgi:hypothetical protein
MLYNNGIPITDTLVQQLIKNEKTSPYATYSSDDN